jgi:hypothetical protein
MKTLIALLVSIIALSTANTIHAQEFRAEEFNLWAFAGDVGKEDSDFAPGIGASYFFTRHLGVGASTHWEEYGGTLIDNLAGEAYFRWPFDTINVAPYALGMLGFSFETDEFFAGLGGGAEWRFYDKWGVFADVRYQFNDDTDDGVGYRLGVRFTF